MYKQCENCGEKHLTETMLSFPRFERDRLFFCNFKCMEAWQIKELVERGKYGD